MSKNKTNIKYKVLLFTLSIVILFLLYKITIGSNVQINADTYYFYVSEKTSASDIADSLKKREAIGSRLSFRIMSAVFDLDEVKPGMYEIKKEWNNYKLLSHFKTFKPKQTVFVTLPPMQRRGNMLEALCRGTGIHPDDVWKVLNDKNFVQELGGFSTESVFAIFLPRNYRIYKKSDAKSLVERMYQEYLFFWNKKRLSKAKEMELTPEEVTVLASIVYSETKLNTEMPMIAGVYLNRIQKNMRLESDPTLVYANKKFGTKRVLRKDKNIDSPYNTYKCKGLPPGPIYTVPTEVIENVLDYEGHDYLYFCAKHDMSGEHIFAETFEDHLENARKYRDKLDEENIF